MSPSPLPSKGLLVQIDFHHTVTYVIARLAGFSHGEAGTIAYASQYVDDATNPGTIHFDNGTTYDRIASAHPVIPKSIPDAVGFEANLDNRLNVEAWLPFHFLPGDGGLQPDVSTETDVVRRLICQCDSPIAARMVEACFRVKGQANALHRLGITAHVFADTFVHYDFVGFNDEINRVEGLLHDQGEGWFHAYKDDIESEMSAALPLGHGMVLTLPDQPFRRWGYIDRDGHPKRRDNPAIFLAACERLLNVFQTFRGDGPCRPLGDGNRAVLQWAFTQCSSEDEKERHEAWMDLLAGGQADHQLSFEPLGEEALQSLRYVPKGVGSWKHQALGTEGWIDQLEEKFPYTEAFERSDWKHFHDALKDHRNTVLDQILKKEFGLQPNPAA